MGSISINTDASKAYVEQLKRMHRSALPVAIRSALNSAAFDVKKNTMPASAKKAFVERKPTFFKANSKVKPATGFDVNSMKSTVGFVKLSGKGNTVEDLEQQEQGGKIGGRSFIPLKKARAGGSWNKNVKSNLRMAKLKNVINSEKGTFSGEREKVQNFVRAAYKAKKLHGSNAFVLGNKWGDGNQTLSLINRISNNKKHRKLKIKRTPIYTFRKNRKITVARTNFMKRASHESGLKLSRFFQNEAIKQLRKFQQ